MTRRLGYMAEPQVGLRMALSDLKKLSPERPPDSVLTEACVDLLQRDCTWAQILDSQ